MTVRVTLSLFPLVPVILAAFLLLIFSMSIGVLKPWLAGRMELEWPTLIPLGMFGGGCLIAVWGLFSFWSEVKKQKPVLIDILEGYGAPMVARPEE